MIRVLTYNVHSCRGADGRLDVGRVSEVIAEARPDIVALQELDVGRRRTGGVDQAHALAERLGMAFQFNAALHVAEERYGDAVLTPLPMRLVRAGPLPTLAGVRGLERRGALWVEVEVPGAGPLQVLTTHLGLVPREQRLQVAALLGPDWLGHAACRAPAVLLGDFNATPRYAAYRALAGRLPDARPRARGRGRAMTFPSRFPVIRIDHVFTTPDVEILAVRAFDGSVQRVASDHLPLGADLRLAAPASAGGAVTPSRD